MAYRPVQPPTIAPAPQASPIHLPPPRDLSHNVQYQHHHQPQQQQSQQQQYYTGRDGRPPVDTWSHNTTAQSQHGSQPQSNPQQMHMHNVQMLMQQLNPSHQQHETYHTNHPHQPSQHQHHQHSPRQHHLQPPHPNQHQEHLHPQYHSQQQGQWSRSSPLPHHQPVPSLSGNPAPQGGSRNNEIAFVPPRQPDAAFAPSQKADSSYAPPRHMDNNQPEADYNKAPQYRPVVPPKSNTQPHQYLSNSYTPQQQAYTAPRIGNLPVAVGLPGMPGMRGGSPLEYQQRQQYTQQHTPPASAMGRPPPPQSQHSQQSQHSFPQQPQMHQSISAPHYNTQQVDPRSQRPLIQKPPPEKRRASVSIPTHMKSPTSLLSIHAPSYLKNGPRPEFQQPQMVQHHLHRPSLSHENQGFQPMPVPVSFPPPVPLPPKRPLPCKRHDSLGENFHPVHLAYCHYTDARLANEIVEVYESLITRGKLRGGGQGERKGRGVSGGLSGRQMFADCSCIDDEMFIEYSEKTDPISKQSEELQVDNLIGGRVERDVRISQLQMQIVIGMQRANWIVYLISEDSIDLMTNRLTRGFHDAYLVQIEDGLLLAQNKLVNILPVFVGRPLPDGTRAHFSHSYRRDGFNSLPSRIRNCLSAILSLPNVVRFAGSVENVALEILRAVDPIGLAQLSNFPALKMAPFLSTPLIFNSHTDSVHRSLLTHGHCIITGPAGCGKTLLATQYAARYRSKYSHHLFITARGQVEAADDFATIFSEVCPDGYPRAPLEDSRLPVLAWLSQSSTYLLIIDGASDRATLRALFMEMKGFYGSVILTCEDPSVAEGLNLRRFDHDGRVLGENSNVSRYLRIDGWTKPQTRLCLGFTLPMGNHSDLEKESMAAIEWLSRRMRGVLPVHLTACYMRVEGLNVTSLADRVSKLEEVMDELLDVETCEKGAPSYLNIIFHLTVGGLTNPVSTDKVKSFMPNDEIVDVEAAVQAVGLAATAILDIVGFVSGRHPVPLYPYVMAACEEFCLPFGGVRASGKWVLTAAISLLESRGLVHQVDSHLGPSLNCHPTVRKLVRARDMSVQWGDSRQFNVENVSEKYSFGVETAVSSTVRNRLAPLERIAVILVRGYKAVDSSTQLDRLKIPSELSVPPPGSQSDKAYRVAMVDHFLDGIASLTVALEENRPRSVLIPDSPLHTALETSLFNLICRCAATPNYPVSQIDHALDLLLRLQQTVRGSTAHPAAADTLDMMARRAEERNDLDRARALHEECLMALAAAHDTRDHVSIARQFVTLATIARTQGDSPSARAYAEAALNTFARWHSTWEHVDVVNSIGILAAQACADKAYSEAEILLDRAMKITEAMAEVPQSAETAKRVIGKIREAIEEVKERKTTKKALQELADRRIRRREADVIPLFITPEMARQLSLEDLYGVLDDEALAKMEVDDASDLEDYTASPRPTLRNYNSIPSTAHPSPSIPHAAINRLRSESNHLQLPPPAALLPGTKPRNSFFLYKIDKRAQLLKPGETGDLTRYIAELWHQESDEVKNVYRDRAAQERKNWLLGKRRKDEGPREPHQQINLINQAEAESQWDDNSRPKRRRGNRVYPNESNDASEDDETGKKDSSPPAANASEVDPMLRKLGVEGGPAPGERLVIAHQPGVPGVAVLSQMPGSKDWVPVEAVSDAKTAAEASSVTAMEVDKDENSSAEAPAYSTCQPVKEEALTAEEIEKERLIEEARLVERSRQQRELWDAAELRRERLAALVTIVEAPPMTLKVQPPLPIQPPQHLVQAQHLHDPQMRPHMLMPAKYAKGRPRKTSAFPTNNAENAIFMADPRRQDIRLQIEGPRSVPGGGQHVPIDTGSMLHPSERPLQQVEQSFQQNDRVPEQYSPFNSSRRGRPRKFNDVMPSLGATASRYQAPETQQFQASAPNSQVVSNVNSPSAVHSTIDYETEDDDIEGSGSRKQSGRKREPLGPPRPANSFILYRKDKHAEFLKTGKLSVENPDDPNGPPIYTAPDSARFSSRGMMNLSKVFGEMWQAEPPETRDRYALLANEVKRKHLEAYPDYKFKPKARSIRAGSQPMDAGALEGGFDIDDAMRDEELQRIGQQLAAVKNLNFDDPEAAMRNAAAQQIHSAVNSNPRILRKMKFVSDFGGTGEGSSTIAGVKKWKDESRRYAPAPASASRYYPPPPPQQQQQQLQQGTSPQSMVQPLPPTATFNALQSPQEIPDPLAQVAIALANRKTRPMKFIDNTEKFSNPSTAPPPANNMRQYDRRYRPPNAEGNVNHSPNDSPRVSHPLPPQEYHYYEQQQQQYQHDMHQHPSHQQHPSHHNPTHQHRSQQHHHSHHTQYAPQNAQQSSAPPPSAYGNEPQPHSSAPVIDSNQRTYNPGASQEVPGGGEGGEWGADRQADMGGRLTPPPAPQIPGGGQAFVAGV